LFRRNRGASRGWSHILDRRARERWLTPARRARRRTRQVLDGRGEDAGRDSSEQRTWTKRCSLSGFPRLRRKGFHHAEIRRAYMISNTIQELTLADGLGERGGHNLNWIGPMKFRFSACLTVRSAARTSGRSPGIPPGTESSRLTRVSRPWAERRGLTTKELVGGYKQLQSHRGARAANDLNPYLHKYGCDATNTADKYFDGEVGSLEGTSNSGAIKEPGPRLI
jgi:hypothetical protein